MNWMERVTKVFYSPREVFSHLNEKPGWFIPVLILVVVSLIAISLTYSPIIRPEQIKRIEASPRLSPEQIEEARSRLEGNFPLVIALVGTVVVTPIALLIVSAVLYGIFSLMGSKATFKRVFAICSYSSLIAALAVVIKTPIQLAKGSSQIYTSAVLAAPGLSTESVLFRLLNSFDIFTLWQLWVVILGFAVICNFSMKKSSIGVVSPWVIYVVLKVFLLGAVLPKG